MPQTATRTGLQVDMAKRRFPNPTKQPIIREEKVSTTFTGPKSFIDRVEEAALKVRMSKAQFISIASHEYAKTVLAIATANPNLDYADLQDRAFGALRAQRETFSRK